MSDVTSIEGNDVDQLLTKLTTVTSKRDAYEILGAYLSDVALGTNRVPFDYQTSFPADEPTCEPTFTRSFVHSDWVDGQDPVQAEQTAREDGFNLRFHRIERDLDALADDTNTAFHCLAELRSALASILGEIKAAINKDRGDIAALENRVYGTETVLTAPPTSVAPGKLLGGVQWFDKSMVAFDTPQGITLLPKVEPIGTGSDPRIDRVAALATLLAENNNVRDAISGGPVNALVAKFGTVTADGYTLADLLDIVPPDATFSSPDVLLQSVAEREAAVIRTSGRADELIASIGGSTDTQSSAAVKLDGFDAIPVEVRTALILAGIKTVGDLGSRNPADVATLLKQQGVTAQPATVAGWIAGAHAFSLIR
jgi:hypothetical protein